LEVEQWRAGQPPGGDTPLRLAIIVVVNRIMTVGSIGAGKSTLARALGDKLGMDVVELDELWWLPGGYERSPSW
jgi:polynucleotide 5'-kinase involved in rRNA processing